MPTLSCPARGRRAPVPTLAVLAPLALALAAGCSSAPRTERTGGPSPLAAEGGTAAADVARVYERAGFIAEGGDIPFVGTVGYFAGATPDSSLVLVALSMANRAFSFLRGGDRYQGAYAVTLEVRRDSVTVQRVETREVIRVASFRETTRSDESIVFQQFMPLPPGDYALFVRVRDEQSGKTGTHETVLHVPALPAMTAHASGAALSTPLAVYEAEPRASFDSLPSVIANPRATLVFGRDSSLQLYLETYGPAAGATGAAVGGDSAIGERTPPSAEATGATQAAAATPVSVPVELSVRGEGGVMWRDTVALPVRRATADARELASAIVEIPVSPLDIGLASVVARRLDVPADSARTPLFVSFGENIAVASFREMLDYLRYFGEPDRVQALRETPREQQAAAWAAFLRETDPVPATPENEAVRDYFQRIVSANERFRGEGAPGWLTDRGRVFIGLGEPDQVYEQGIANLSQRGRTMIWQYNRYRTQLVFIDQTGFGRWRLTTGSEADFESLLRRRRQP